MDKKRVLLGSFMVLIPFLLVLLSYKLVFYFSEYNPEQKQVIDFLQEKEKLQVNMTAAEVSHLEDVKKVIKKVDFVFYFLLFFVVFIIFYNYKDGKYLKKLFLYGGIFSLILMVLFLILILINFDFLFTLFHQIFFAQGNWLFPAESFLIQTFPLEFFGAMGGKIFLLSLVLASLFILIGISLRKK